jgi:RND family efflux transporter MFP subunit
MKNNLSAIIIFVFLATSCGKKKAETQTIRKDLTETVFASGALEADAKYNLTAQSEGYLTEVNIEDGDLITVNQLVAVIDNRTSNINAQSANEQLAISKINVSPNAPSLRQIEANIQIAQEKLNQDKLQMERYKKLYEVASVSKLESENMTLAYQTSKANVAALQEQYQAIKLQAEQQLIAQQSLSKANSVNVSYNQVRAFVAGKIYKKLKQKGDYVRKGDVIATVGSASQIYAKLNIDESSIANVKIGQQAVMQLNTNKSKQYKGEVYEILPTFDENSQSFVVKVRFTESLDFTIAGTQLEANLIVANRKNVLLIPRNYLGYGNKVVVKGEKDPVVVQVGFVSSDWVEIKSGLKGTETIETENVK